MKKESCVFFSGFHRHKLMCPLRLLTMLALCLSISGGIPRSLFAENAGNLTVLIIYEEGDEAETSGLGTARQFATLLGHFHTTVTFKRGDQYQEGEMAAYDVAAFIGYTEHCAPPLSMMRDVNERTAPFIWLNTGMLAFDRAFSTSARYGFRATEVDSQTSYPIVIHNGEMFSRNPSENTTTVTALTDKTKCEVIATLSSKNGAIPYVLKSGNFWYFADCPFWYATETDRYLLFADLLHDILGVDHPRSHRALIRIEDVHPLEDPDLLRAIADLLHSEQVPFLVALIPYFVDPEHDVRVSLSEKQDFVDAIHYMVRLGGTVVMHGVTHQYKGVSATDFEFWDESINKPIKTNTPDYVLNKMRTGLGECIRNGIYPVVWETPHYAASQKIYDGIAAVFSSAVEQRLAIDDTSYGQYFPYIIERDLHGQKLYPENLGYIPYNPEKPEDVSQRVEDLIRIAKSNLSVRDGFASCFYHPCVPLENLQRLVRGIKGLGFTFVDLKDQQNTVALKDKVIVTGGGKVELSLSNQYLREYTFGRDGGVIRKTITPERINGEITRDVSLSDGQIYLATPSELPDRQASGYTKKIRNLFDQVSVRKHEKEAGRAAILLDSSAVGEALKDQSSLRNAFQCLGIKVDAITAGALPALDNYNFIIVPYNAAETLSDSELSLLIKWIRAGGNCITDGISNLSQELGLEKLGSILPIERLRDLMFPDENLVWGVAEHMTRFSTSDADRIFVVESETGCPVIIGRTLDRGRLIYSGCRFDPESDAGYSRFPHIVEYAQAFFNISPVLARHALEMYFDPGFRGGVSIETLVKRWAKIGVSAIHVAGWEEYPKYVYDYERLITLCHSNGILVYAWLEPPMVSQKFWQDHPECREKNAQDNDVHPSWRLPVAMTESACVDKMFQEYKALLERQDFDGVNFAEVYFESSNSGPEDPSTFTPMHISARNEFQRLNGFDPILLLDESSPYYWEENPQAWKKFEDYRVDKGIEITERLLGLAEGIKASRPGFDVVVTVLDSIGTPSLRRCQGVDIRRVIALKKEHDFTLAVEDPQERWSEDPRRYKEIAEQYRKIVGNDFMLDLNILPFRSADESTPFPTLRPTGTEAFFIVAVAAQAAGRSVLYSESSIDSQDLHFLPFAAATTAHVKSLKNGLEVSSPYSVTAHLGKPRATVTIDGSAHLTTEDGQVLVPAGTHVIETKSWWKNMFSTGQTGIVSITGNLLYSKNSERSVDFQYESVPRCFVTLEKPPTAVYVDNAQFQFYAMQGDRRFSVCLPPGKHYVHVVTMNAISYGLGVMSFWSSSLIAAFGILAFSALSACYLLARGRKAVAIIKPQRKN
jgi:uncharacterized protein YdaL